MILCLEFPLVGWLREGRWDILEHLTRQFAEKTNGVFYGPCMAMDRLALRARCPRVDEVPDPGNYYCQKGFYALSRQAICDKLKRFLWVYPSVKGSMHDSTAFAGSKLYDLLHEAAVLKGLKDHNLFIVGDSAYSNSPFLLVPYAIQSVKDDVDGARDSFNYHLSSCRIYIECAFGELVMRWGIFWRTLRFDLAKSMKIIKVCMLLHNFIVDHRNGEDTEDAAFFRTFNIRMDRVQRSVTRQTGEMPTPLVTDNNEPDPGGRPSLVQMGLIEEGNAIRESLTVKLAALGMKPPIDSDMHVNNQGNVYF